MMLLFNPDVLHHELLSQVEGTSLIAKQQLTIHVIKSLAG